MLCEEHESKCDANGSNSEVRPSEKVLGGSNYTCCILIDTHALTFLPPIQLVVLMTMLLVPPNTSTGKRHMTSIL